MAKTTEEFHVKFSADNSSFKKAMDDNKKSAEGFLESENKVKNGLASATSSLIGATDGADVLSKAMGGLEGVFKSSLAIGGLVTVGLKLRDVLVDQAKKMNELNDVAAGQFARTMGGTNKSVGELSKQFEDARDAAEKFRKTNADFDTLGGNTKNALGLLFGGEHKVVTKARNEDIASGLDKQALAIQKAMADVEERRTMLQQKISGGYTTEAAALQRQWDREKEIAAAEEQHNFSGIKAIKDRHKAEDELIAKQQEAAQDQVNLQKVVNEARRSGVDTELVSAKALYDLRKKQAEQANDPAEKQQASAALEAASLDLEATKKKLDIEKQTVIASTVLAGLAGTEYERKKQTLAIEEQILRNRLEGATDREKGPINSDLARNKAAQEAAEQAQRGANIRDAIGQADAGKGPGSHEELQASELKLKLALANVKVEEASAQADDHKLAALKQQVEIQAKALEQQALQVQASDEDIRLQGKTVDIQTSTLDAAEKNYQVALATVDAEQAKVKAAHGVNKELEDAEKLRLRSAKYAADEAKAQATVSKAQQALHEETVKIEGGAGSESSKRYQTTLAQIKAINAEIAAYKQLVPEIAKAKEIEKERLENDLKQQDRSLNMGKSGKEIRERLRTESRQEKQTEKFDSQRKDNSGLIDVHKDSDGNVISGINPVTGDREDRPQASALDKPLDAIKDLPSLKDRMQKDTDDFRKRFQKPEAAPAVQPAEDSDTDEDDDSGIISAISDLKDAVLQAIAK